MAELNDESPQVRRIAAIAIGKKGGRGASIALADALSREDVAWVRPSIILALGKIADDDARIALAAIEPRSETESEALRKARDRVSAPASGFAWRLDAVIDRLYAGAPIGLEDVAIAEAAERGIEAGAVRRGMIKLSAKPEGLLNQLRCVYDIRFLIAEGPAGAFGETIAKARLPWREWIASENDTLPYRFSLENVRVTRQQFSDVLRGARETFTPLGLTDSPSRYASMLRVEADADATRIWLVPTFEADQRFAYRLADVGASINPVVGACLARLVRGKSSRVVVDPTCGSGTLLIERALLDPDVMLSGIDISPTAIRAATGNVIAARLAARIAVRQADSGDAVAWPERCDEVLANLPFGNRTEDRNLDGLYRRVVGNIGRTLAQGGRVLLYTAHTKTLVALLHRTHQLRILEERRVESGGLQVGLWLLEKR
jgi:23S rRNA G2445 N2-methylase RlmL